MVFEVTHFSNVVKVVGNIVLKQLSVLKQPAAEPRSVAKSGAVALSEKTLPF